MAKETGNQLRTVSIACSFRKKGVVLHMYEPYIHVLPLVAISVEDPFTKQEKFVDCSFDCSCTLAEPAPLLKQTYRVQRHLADHVESEHYLFVELSAARIHNEAIILYPAVMCMQATSGLAVYQ